MDFLHSLNSEQMVTRLRKPHSYRLNLVPLESRDVPATWHVEMLSSNPGSTDATITDR